MGSISKITALFVLVYTTNAAWAMGDQADFAAGYIRLTKPALSSSALPERKISQQDMWRDRIIIAGDSWANFPCKSGAMEEMIEAVKAEFRNDPRCTKTSKLGVEARNWTGTNADLNLRDYIRKDKQIKYIYFSLGGNDFLGQWNAALTEEAENALFNRVYKDVHRILQNYIGIRPDIKIILSGYDYPNFKSGRKVPVFSTMFKHMMQPTALRINSFMAKMSSQFAQIVDHQNIYYIHHLGLAQYYDGGPKGTFLPQTTTSPDDISPFMNPAAIGGDLTQPTREESMKRWYMIIRDAFHLNDRNYANVMLHTYHNVLVNIGAK